MKVVKVLDSEIKSGQGAKGPWSMSLVELDDGKQVNIFNPIAEGDEVEAYDNKGFTNYRKVKTPAGSDYSKALKYIAEQNLAILQQLKLLDGKMDDLALKIEPGASTQATDKVAEVPQSILDGSEEVDLDSIPF